MSTAPPARLPGTSPRLEGKTGQKTGHLKNGAGFGFLIFSVADTVTYGKRSAPDWGNRNWAIRRGELKEGFEDQREDPGQQYAHHPLEHGQISANGGQGGFQIGLGNRLGVGVGGYSGHSTQEMSDLRNIPAGLAAAARE